MTIVHPRRKTMRKERKDLCRGCKNSWLCFCLSESHPGCIWLSRWDYIKAVQIIFLQAHRKHERIFSSLQDWRTFDGIRFLFVLCNSRIFSRVFWCILMTLHDNHFQLKGFQLLMENFMLVKSSNKKNIKARFNGQHMFGKQNQ